MQPLIYLCARALGECGREDKDTYTLLYDPGKILPLPGPGALLFAVGCWDWLGECSAPLSLQKAFPEREVEGKLRMLQTKTCQS